MTTRALDDLDGGLGSCLPNEDLSLLEGPCPGRRPENKARGTSRIEESTSWPVDPRDSVIATAADARPKKMEKEPEAKGVPGPGKEKLKAGASPRSAPARKKSHATPPLQSPPPPPQALSPDLSWGDVTLNKCLVLASLLALLGSALQVCLDAMAREVPISAPQPWVPPKKPVSPRTKPVGLAPPSEPPAFPPGSPAPQAETEDRPEVPQTAAAENFQGESEESTGKATGEEESVLLVDRSSQERSRKEKPRNEERLKKEKQRKEEKPRKERPRKERPRATKEPREALPRRWEAREGKRGPGTRDPRDPEHGKPQVWSPPRRRDEDDDWPPGRRKRRVGKGRD